MVVSKRKRIDHFLSGTAGGSFDKPMELHNPLIVMFETPDGKITCHIHRRIDDTHQTYGLLICDLVRHVSNAFKVDEDDVWDWVDKEREHHTTDITVPS